MAHAGHVGEPFGTVFIAEDIFAIDGPRFFAYWDAEPDEKPRMLEEMPETDDLATAIAWGRARTLRVFVRPTVRGYYSAGLIMGDPPLPTWPPQDAELRSIEAERAELMEQARRERPVRGSASPPE
ncbi:MAG: hypothetical protein KDC36_12900 [Thermoleophilia bacterium]|nr:hypothetical protein [Thermoleophilia bacterium]